MTVFRESFLMVFLFLCRHLFRLLPFIGIIGMPILCLTEYHVYRRMFLWKTGKVQIRGKLDRPGSGSAFPAFPPSGKMLL